MKNYLRFLCFTLACASCFAGFACMTLGIYADSIGVPAGFDLGYGAWFASLVPMMGFGVVSAALE